MSSLAEHFSLEKKDVLHPVNYKTIMQYQQNNKPLIETAKLNKDYSIKLFYGAAKKYSLWDRGESIQVCEGLEVGWHRLLRLNELKHFWRFWLRC